MIAEGKYRAKAMDAALGTSGEKNTPQIAVLFSLLDLPGQDIIWFGFLSEAAWERTCEGLEYCGWSGEDLAVFDPEYVAANGLSGLDTNEVEIVVKHETYKDKVQAKVQWVNKLGGGMAALKNTMTGQAAKSFAEQMRGNIMARRQAQGSAPGNGGAKPPGGFPWETGAQK